MKKAQREIYIKLAETVDYVPCSFCKYSECVGCNDGECKHPLSDRGGFPYFDGDLYPGDDCWGFRPQYNVSTTADVVGVILSKGWQSAGWGENKEGQLVVWGVGIGNKGAKRLRR